MMPQDIIQFSPCEASRHHEAFIIMLTNSRIFLKMLLFFYNSFDRQITRDNHMQIVIHTLCTDTNDHNINSIN